MGELAAGAMSRPPSEAQVKKELLGWASERRRLQEEGGEPKALAEACLNVAQIHILAGQVEDHMRYQMFLPQANHHAAAAGGAAQEALQLYRQVNDPDKMRLAQEILDIERVRSSKHLHGKPFNYDYALYK